MCYSQIWQNFGGDKYLCKLGKEYLNASLCKFVVYSLQHSENFDVTRLSATNRRWVINAQTGPVFLAHPVVCWHFGNHCCFSWDDFCSSLDVATEYNLSKIRRSWYWTPRIGSLTGPVLFWCVSLPWSIGSNCSLWQQLTADKNVWEKQPQILIRHNFLDIFVASI